MSKFSNFIKAFGPGIMFAGTCIGGSHLVQSTKAGAFYGFGLLAVVLAANIFKYPFFEFASRYTSATGDSILEGYRKQGKWILVIYGVITVFSMFIITAAIGTFTAGLANNIANQLFGASILNLKWWAIILFVIVFAILAYGKFNVLDILLKIIGLILVVTVFTAFFGVVSNKPFPTAELGVFDIISSKKGLIFGIALMGWMPIAVDMSTWHSLWTQERIKQTGYHPSLKETLLDFNIGYIISLVLAILFLSIGAYVLYGHPVYTK
ncbi:MAG: Nramp family divalent metal transporter, partial [Cyclobacteriaceae bacterium]